MKLNLTAIELGQIVGAKSISPLNDALISEVAYDSRNISTGEGIVFFALDGAQQSGFFHVEDAYQKGVRIFVLKMFPDLVRTDALYLIVSDPLKALQDLAAFHRKRLNYPIIAITESIGKTRPTAADPIKKNIPRANCHF